MTVPQSNLSGAASALESFTAGDLTARIAALESSFAGADTLDVQRRLLGEAVSHDLLGSAYLLKRAAGQINVVIHAIGILLCLPHLLNAGERVEYLSLGAGNTGRSFDLETDQRVAEFKFIHWQGGSETIRQNALFKDLYLLAEYQTPKHKYMYVLDTTHPLKFLRGRRALSSIMSRNRKLWEGFQARHGEQFTKVREYYSAKGSEVTLQDISPLLSELLAHS